MKQKNIGRKGLNFNEINKWPKNLTLKSFEMPYVSYYQPLSVIQNEQVSYRILFNF